MSKVASGTWVWLLVLPLFVLPAGAACTGSSSAAGAPDASTGQSPDAAMEAAPTPQRKPSRRLRRRLTQGLARVCSEIAPAGAGATRFRRATTYPRYGVPAQTTSGWSARSARPPTGTEARGRRRAPRDRAARSATCVPCGGRTRATYGRLVTAARSSTGTGPRGLHRPSTGKRAFNPIWGSGPSDVWAVGYYGGDSASTGAFGTVAHFDGTTWSPSTLPADAGPIPTGANTYGLHGVWGSGPNDVWIVGDSGTLRHYDGSGWTDFGESPDGNTAAPLVAVWGSGIQQRLGTQRRRRSPLERPVVVASGLPLQFQPKSIWGSGANDIWTVGSSERGRKASCCTGTGARGLRRPVLRRTIPCTGYGGAPRGTCGP